MNVGGITASYAAIAIRHPEGGVTGAGACTLGVNQIDDGVGGVIKDQARVTRVACGDCADSNIVNTISFYAVAPGSFHVHGVKANTLYLVIPIRAAVVVDTNTGSSAHANVDATKMKIADIAEEHGVGRRACNANVRDADVLAAARINGCVVTRTRAGCFQSAAHVEQRLAWQTDTRVGAERTGALDKQALHSRSSCGQTVERALDGIPRVATQIRCRAIAREIPVRAGLA